MRVVIVVAVEMMMEVRAEDIICCAMEYECDVEHTFTHFSSIFLHKILV